MSDIVERELENAKNNCVNLGIKLAQAADRIEQLEAEILHLHTLLTKWSDANNEMADRIEHLEARVVEAEIALNVWDKAHVSEYWLRHAPPSHYGRNE